MIVRIFATVKKQPSPFIRGKEINITNWDDLTDTQRHRCIAELIMQQIDMKVVENETGKIVFSNIR